jgi:signal transduction histidine kinase
MVAARRQSVTVEAPSQPLRIDGDVVRLTEVVGNLLTNASKFSADGARIHVVAERGADGSVQMRVRDEGAGIDAQILPQVFELFVQGDQSLDRAQGGLGIGLTVAKRLIELHGGRIAAASAGAGRGSEFTITLPPGVLAEREPKESVAAPATTARRILVLAGLPEAQRGVLSR